jgi:multidrug efflux pump subunit AcrA (membrane-fusion protein)
VGNALDLFRAQQAAVEQVLDRLNDVADLLTRLNDQATQLAHDRELRQLLQEERTWLDTAHRLVNETRHWREEDTRRYWPSLMYRWIAASLFALTSVYVAAVGYARVTKPFAQELETLRPRAELGQLVEDRMSTMTPAERRQLDALMKWKRGAR